MKPLSRSPVNKQRSAQQFRKHTYKTKKANIIAPMRGGWRM